ncbi:YhdH/YhfP family quinone oxidoreductase [Rhizosphaericola mali]|uniref:YhdH/YhfP family quinone oxidoreductase n=1 Tax=Rhizosphaericola mali TaxID=2545455 RepID=A0A5P2FZN8_9BACT|nr:YhdH/YhfP family quinone oxidoreductase [Rhizosphaericola mali]QES88427.1 YhdH/YhfP family quinone oxidoreductase [Rhizosphaericola mali]
MNKTYRCLLTEKSADGTVSNAIVTRDISALKPSEVLIEVHYSSLNYKDALSALGTYGVTTEFPHTPGIDAVGVVVSSQTEAWKPGDEVIVTGFDFGMNTDGGFSELASVPADWLVKLPEGLTMKESMMYGTAGLAAGQSVAALIHNDVTPEDGVIAVSGASGGVGSLAVGILHKLGYKVAAVSGKASASEYLKSIGASEILDRDELNVKSPKAILKPRFAGAVDTVGGEILANLIKMTDYGGTVTNCGMVAGGDIPITVFPFILKGINLMGIDTVNYPIKKREPIWKHFASDWRPDNLEDTVTEISLDELPDSIAKISQGKLTGRYIVKLK